MTKGKTTLIKKYLPPQRDPQHQLLTDNVSTYGVENFNSTD